MERTNRASRATALLLAACVVAIQLPLPALTGSLAGRCDPATLCDPRGPATPCGSCGPLAEPMPADPCGGGTRLSAAGPHEETRGRDSCCPGGCHHCPLPCFCCDGMPLASSPPATAASRPFAVAALALLPWLAPSAEPGQIFHPPRR